MNIRIDLVISANPELLDALLALTGKTEVTGTPAPAPVVTLPESNGEVKKTRKVKVPSEPLNASDKEIAAMGVIEAATDTMRVITTDLTQEMIIADAVPKSKAGHKDKIKAKVTELGYDSITDLQPEHFNEMWSFLQTIPKPA